MFECVEGWWWEYHLGGEEEGSNVHSSKIWSNSPMMGSLRTLLT